MAKLLVIDDDLLTQATLAEMLRDHGHDVETATNGRLGLKAMAAARFDLVLTDVLMPEMDGLEVVRAVVKGHPGVALVAMSGGSSRLPGSDAIQLSRLLGAHAVLIKPFSEDELRAAVAKALAAVGKQSA